MNDKILLLAAATVLFAVGFIFGYCLVGVIYA